MKEDIDELIKKSMKAKTRTRTEVLRAIKTAFLVHETQKNAKPLDKATEIAIIKKLRDQRIDNAEQYRMAGRQDLYDIEMRESLILNEFLPEIPGEEQLRAGLFDLALIYRMSDKLTALQFPKKNMGTIIKGMKDKFPAADGKQISDLVKIVCCMMNNLETSDPILFAISCEIHRLILKSDSDGFLGFSDEIADKKELVEQYNKIREKMPYLDPTFVLNELRSYMK